MTKKHFIELANVIKDAERYAAFTDEQKHVLAGFCATFNPKFDREWWFGYIAGTNSPNGGKRNG